MNLNLVAGTAATIVLVIPVLLILIGRLFSNGSLLSLLAYNLFTGFYNLVDLGIIELTSVQKQKLAAAFNYLDAPLMLITLLFFCNEKWKRKLVLSALGLYVLYGVVIAVCFGLQRQSSVYLLGPGILLVLGFSVYFFAYYGKQCIVHNKGTGKTFMLVSILFSYGCFLVLYYLDYLAHTPAMSDVFLIFYISTFISAVSMSIGLFWIIKQARAIKELQHTRRELALFFDK
jgi:hypothetical protein